MRPNKLIDEFCKPLRKLALTNFMHDITFGKGEISMLISSDDIFLFYSQHKIPMFCTDHSGRTLTNGIYINKLLEERYADCSVLLPLMVRVGQQFGQNFGKNSLHIVQRETDCQHLYSLFFDLNEHDFLQWIINNGSFLEDLIANYNRHANDQILAAKAPENRIILPNSDQMNLATVDFKSKNLSLSVVHKKLKMPVHLSTQQSRCLLLLMKGKSAKEIANEMQLSHRTVEHYLESVRKTLGCTSNKELVISYYEQLVKED